MNLRMGRGVKGSFEIKPYDGDASAQGEGFGDTVSKANHLGGNGPAFAKTKLRIRQETS